MKDFLDISRKAICSREMFAVLLWVAYPFFLVGRASAGDDSLNWTYPIWGVIALLSIARDQAAGKK